MLELTSLLNNTTNAQNSNQSKKIVNISKCSPSTSSSASSSSASSSSSSSTAIKTTILNIPQTFNLIADSRSVSPPPTIQTESQTNLLTNSARKRRKQDFKINSSSLLAIKSELKNSDENNNNECVDENDKSSLKDGLDSLEEEGEEDEVEPPKKITKTEINNQFYELDDETVEKLSKGLFFS